MKTTLEKTLKLSAAEFVKPDVAPQCASQTVKANKKSTNKFPGSMALVLLILCQLLPSSARQWRAVGLGPPVSDISNGTFVHVPYTYQQRHQKKPLIFGMTSAGHDMGFAATLGSEVLAVLELERYHKIRYFDLRVLSGMNENFQSVGDLCLFVMDHRHQDCIDRLSSMRMEPGESEMDFEIRHMKHREKILYENAMERGWALNSTPFLFCGQKSKDVGRVE